MRIPTSYHNRKLGVIQMHSVRASLSKSRYHKAIRTWWWKDRSLSCKNKEVECKKVEVK